jgi:hypothetical protein
MFTRKFVSIISLFLLISIVFAPVQITQAAPMAAASDGCRFGINVSAWAYIKTFGINNESVSRYDLASLGVGYYLDWGKNRRKNVPETIKYTHVLRTSDASFQSNMDVLPSYVKTYPGDIWIIGNEPDQPHEDANTAETYAERFYAFSTLIHNIDPTAIVSFGTLTSITQARIRYLNYAWDHLVALAGSPAAAAALIDVFSPHMYILTEEILYGVLIPPSINSTVYNEYLSLAEQTTAADIYSFDKFKQRLTWMREWMKSRGLERKPLWVTEYGNLLPPYNMPGLTNLTSPYSVTIDFMLKTFDWMYSQKDTNIGNPNDSYRLTQKWFWFSLNDMVFHFGGTLIDPLTMQDTPVGTAFRNYTPPADPTVVVTPPSFITSNVSVTPVRRSANNNLLVDYIVKIRVHNNVIDDFNSNASVSVTENGALIGSGSTRVARCGGDGIVTMLLHGSQPGVSHTFNVKITPIGSGTGSQADITVPATQFGMPRQLYIPRLVK